MTPKQAAPKGPHGAEGPPFDFKATLIHRAANGGEMDRWMVAVDGFVTEYSKGVGHREGFKLPLTRTTVADMEDFNNPRKSRTVDPTLIEVLEALANDASIYVESGDEDDFASNYCEGMSFSETRKMWEACQRAHHFFASRGLQYIDYLDYDDEDDDDEAPQ